MTLRELLTAAGKGHRGAVAAALDLPAGAGVEEIARRLEDETHLTALVGSLSEGARTLATGGALDGGGLAVHGYSRHGGLAAELEQVGIVFCLEESWRYAYRVPQDLRAPLARALAARHAEGVTRGRATRYLSAPLQTAHDAAVLSAFMERTPVRVKADGDIYSRFWPKLLAALPGLDLFSEQDTLGELRADLALGFLREGALLRLRVDDRPGSEVRRELVPAGNLATVLDAPGDALRERLLAAAVRSDFYTAGGLALAGTLAGRTVSLPSFGEALRELLEDGGAHVHPSWTDPLLALRGLEGAWLAGAVELGLDGEGRPAAARLEPVAPEAPAAPPALCQGNFEVVLMRPPAPAERLVLELACERSAQHTYRITRKSVRCGERTDLGPGGVAGALERLAGELPQNVARSIADWSEGAPRRLRLRTAMMVEAGDCDTADRLADGPLAGLVTERLSERLLAVPGGQVDAVERALASAGHELEPGLERVSGRWRETEGRSGQAEACWAPAGDESEPVGRVMSTIELAKRRSAARVDQVTQPAPGEPLGVILRALEARTDVEITYAGARGVTHRQVTPLELEGGALHAFCHLRGDGRSFWLSSIRSAELVA